MASKTTRTCALEETVRWNIYTRTPIILNPKPETRTPRPHTLNPGGSVHGVTPGVEDPSEMRREVALEVTVRSCFLPLQR